MLSLKFKKTEAITRLEKLSLNHMLTAAGYDKVQWGHIRWICTEQKHSQNPLTLTLTKLELYFVLRFGILTEERIPALSSSPTSTACSRHALSTCKHLVLNKRLSLRHFGFYYLRLIFNLVIFIQYRSWPIWGPYETLLGPPTRLMSHVNHLPFPPVTPETLCMLYTIHTPF